MARKITDELYNFIEGKLKNHGAAQVAITKGDARSLLAYAADACVGIKEEGGNNNGKFVKLIQRTVDNKASQEAWCMAYVQSIVAYVERKLGVKSHLHASEHCMSTWRATPAKYRVKKIPGSMAIIIWKNGKTDSGHTGFMSDFQGTKSKMETYEGNTGSGSMFDGDGVYIRQRSKVKDGKLVIQGYIIPFEASK